MKKVVSNTIVFDKWTTELKIFENSTFSAIVYDTESKNTLLSVDTRTTSVDEVLNIINSIPSGITEFSGAGFTVVKDDIIIELINNIRSMAKSIAILCKFDSDDELY